jgi:hypothetical protein
MNILMLKKFIKILSSLFILLFLSLSLSGCKNQEKTSNLNSDIVFTKFSFNTRNSGKSHSAIGNWEVNTNLYCPNLIFDGNPYFIDQKFTKSGNEIIDFPSDENYNCELTIQSFKINNTHYIPKNSNSLFKIKKNNSTKNLFNFVNQIDPNDHKFITGKMNAHSFSLHIFEKVEDAAVFNDIEISFIPLTDPQYVMLKIDNNTRTNENVIINEIDLTDLKTISLQNRSKNDIYDIKYGDNYECIDTVADNEINRRVQTLGNRGRCALVFFREKNIIFSEEKISISIDNASYDFNINITNNNWSLETIDSDRSIRDNLFHTRWNTKTLMNYIIDNSRNNVKKGPFKLIKTKKTNHSNIVVTLANEKNYNEKLDINLIALKKIIIANKEKEQYPINYNPDKKLSCDSTYFEIRYEKNSNKHFLSQPKKKATFIGAFTIIAKNPDFNTLDLKLNFKVKAVFENYKRVQVTIEKIN